MPQNAMQQKHLLSLKAEFPNL